VRRIIEVVQVAGWRRGSSRSSNGTGRDSACAADAAAHEPRGNGHVHATGRGNVSQKSSRCCGFAAPLLRTRSNKWCIIIIAPSCAFSSLSVSDPYTDVTLSSSKIREITP
jgi:hypothetical protein